LNVLIDVHESDNHLLGYFTLCIADKKFLRKPEVINALDLCFYQVRNGLKKEEINLKLFFTRKQED